MKSLTLFILAVILLAVASLIQGSDGTVGRGT